MSLKTKKTTLKFSRAQTGDGIQAENANWTFGGEVCQHFDAHVSKSVPLYTTGHDLVAKISDYFLQQGSVCYDLGCSTGKLLSMLAHRHLNKGIQFIGVDCEENMANYAENVCNPHENVSIVSSDLLDIDFEKADLIICYYTIQFISPKHRQEIFNRIYKALNWGGALLLFEKTRAPDARFQDILSSLYVDFKLDNGYVPDEIIGKMKSLKGVLEPFSREGNLDLMQRAGFVDMVTVLKYLSFEGFLAIK